VFNVIEDSAFSRDKVVEDVVKLLHKRVEIIATTDEIPSAGIN
jgi:hypothetical protein